MFSNLAISSSAISGYLALYSEIETLFFLILPKNYLLAFNILFSFLKNTDKVKLEIEIPYKIPKFIGNI